MHYRAPLPVLAIAAVTLCGCVDDAAPSGTTPDTATTASVALADAVERIAAALDRATVLADSVEDLLRPVPLLTPAEEAALRTSNAAQLARARQLGAHAADTATLRAHIEAGRLVQLEDSTDWWVVRELRLSLPYVTPDTRMLLGEIGRRFQAVLRERGLPAYRVEVTSILRTPADQAALRAGNINAARGTSTHEFGTTLDITYESYGAPVTDADAGNDALLQLEQRIRSLALERVGAQKSRELQKLLGGVLREMMAEGMLLVTLERQQPVYHLTVARALAAD